jgi:hypothetical protein
MRATLAILMIGTVVTVAACEQKAPPAPPPPPPAAPPPPPPAATPPKPKMVAPTDGLSLADRIAKRQAEEKKLADQLAGEENQRLLAYDKTKLPLHQQVWASIKKFRAAYDKAKSKDDVLKIQVKQEKEIVATGKKMATIDPKGGNSNITTDYDVMLNALANDYPDALAASFGGDPAAKEGLAAQNAELDKRGKKIEEWLAQVKSAKPAKVAKK